MPPAKMPQASGSANQLTGQQIGRYLVQERIGSGGVATVYRAFDQVDQRVVAFKALTPSADETTISRFRNEALTAGRLRHPNIVSIYQVGTATDSHVPYIAMALVEGESLADLLARTGRLSPVDACALLEPIARALAFAHSEGVVHRDVKPSNILLQPADAAGSGSILAAMLNGPVMPMLTDFGVARALDAPELTGLGQTVGTPAYMAPEQASGSRRIDGRADIYAIGAVLYRAIVGHLPFSGSASQILHAHVYEPLTIEDDLLYQLPPAVIDILKRAMAKQPEARYADASSLANALAAASGRPAPVTSTTAVASMEASTDAATGTMPVLAATTPEPKRVSVLAPVADDAPASAPDAQSPRTGHARRWWLTGPVLIVIVLAALLALLVGGVLAFDSLMLRFGDENGTAPAAFLPVTVPAVQPGPEVGGPRGDVALVLVTATPAAGEVLPPQPSATPQPDVSEGIVSQLVTPTATALPSPSPTVHPPAVRPPSNRPPSAVLPAPSQDTVPPEQEVFTCANVIDPTLLDYIAGMDASFASGYRCPNSGAAYTTGEFLRFEHGFMLDLANDPSIYIFYDINQEWERAVSSWQEGDASTVGEIVPPAPNLYQPQEAFGQLWADPQRRVALGFATVAAPSSFSAVEQTFPAGALIRNADDGTMWLLLREKLRL